MKVRMLCEVWKDWKNNAHYTAALGDGSPIEAVGRPHHGICEVHSTRGIEHRHSTEQVLCEDIEPRSHDQENVNAEESY